MASVLADEIVPGLVVHIDPDKLRALGRCRTNAAQGAEVKGVHYFLVLHVRSDRSDCLAVPLYSEKNDIRDRIRLDHFKKTGKAEHWVDSDSFYYKWQFWRIPLAYFEQASVKDDSDIACRRMYAANDPVALLKITADIKKTKAPWRYV